ncbi:MAG: FkbM family methyltransferase [Bacteroidia bacterium]|nr:FkbM family methyltransferase [Bacteroidia bacterium]
MCINFLFNSKNINSVNYLELGAYDPCSGSNTYFFYKNNNSGILIEADSNRIHKIKEKRPKDKVLNIGIGINDNESEADFYKFEEPAHNTFDKNEAEFREKNGSYKLIEICKVKMTSINKIIAENYKSGYPDFLSIDIEGFDFEVLNHLDHNTYPIPVICAETCKYSENHIKEKDKRFEKLMESKGYFIYADTYINTIFVNKNWFYNS